MSFKDVLAALCVAALWGGNFIAAMMAMQTFPPIFMSALRFFLVALVLVPFVPFPEGRLREALYISLTFSTLQFSFVFTGIHMGLDVTTSVLTTQMGVPFSCLLSALFLGDRLGLWRTLGLLTAFGGLVLIAGEPRVTEHWEGFLLVLIGTFFWSISNIQIKRSAKWNILSLLGWMSLVSAPQMLLLSLLLEEGQWESLQAAGWLPWASVMYSVIFSTIVAYGLWYHLLAKHPVSQVVPYSLLVPFFAVSFGMWIFDEQLSWKIVVGGIILMSGVTVIVFRRPRLPQTGGTT